MALPPSLKPLLVAGTNAAPHSLDIFCTLLPVGMLFLLSHSDTAFLVDYVCPYRLR